MAENLNLKTVETVDTRPFRKLVMTIGELPTSYIESMTYYELLTWFVNYLETVIIPTVNNNGEAVEELQQKYIELKANTEQEIDDFENQMTTAFNTLKNFVDNYFDNLDVQDEINNKLDDMAEHGILQEIIANFIYKKLFLASELGMLPTNSESVAINNYTILKNAMEAGYNVLIDDAYYLKNTDSTNTIQIIANQELQGKDINSKLINYDDNYLYLFDHNEFDLAIRNLKFENGYSHDTTIIGNWSTNDEKYKYGSIEIIGCRFDGNVKIIDIDTLESVLRDETWGIPSIKVNANYVNNSNVRSLYVANVPFGEILINDNTIHNVKPYFGRFNPTHSESITQGVEYLRYVKADGNIVTYDDNVFASDATYCSFLVCVCRNAILTNNYIEGLKANDDTAVYSAYLSCYYTVFENNIVKNVINFYESENNYLFKAKSGGGTRLYRNNTITLDPTWVATINAALASPYSDADLASHTTCAIYHSDTHQDKWTIENNIIDVLRIDNKSRYRDITYFEFLNNTVKCTQMAGYLFAPETHNKYAHIIGNQFYVSEASTGFMIINGSNYQNTSDLLITDNIIDSNSSIATLVSTEGTFGNIDIENNKITLSNSTAGSSSVRSILLMRNSIYKTLTLKNNIWSDNKTTAQLINICNGKLDVDEKFITAGMDTTSNVDTYYLDKTVLYDQKLLITLTIMNDSGVFETTQYVLTLHNDGTDSYIKYTDASDVEQDLNLTTVASNTIKDVKPATGTSKLTVAVRTTTSYITFKALTTNSKRVKIGIESI